MTITIHPDYDESVWVCGTERINRFAVGIGNQELVIIQAPTDELAREWAKLLASHLKDWKGECVLPDPETLAIEREERRADYQLDSRKE